MIVVLLQSPPHSQGSPTLGSIQVLMARILPMEAIVPGSRHTIRIPGHIYHRILVLWQYKRKHKPLSAGDELITKVSNPYKLELGFLF